MRILSYETSLNKHKYVDVTVKIWYFKINKVIGLINEKICKLREKLNKSIQNGENYDKIYEISIELDELITEYYKDTE